MKYRLSIVSILFLMSVSVNANLEPSQIKEHPKYSAEITIQSHGKKLPAIFYGAEGKGPHPTILLLHGYPGNEKNLDVAQVMRNAGWNVVFFHYRGAWGAEGDFSFTNSEQDVIVVTKFLQQADIGQKFKIDTKRISYIGHSMGGHMAVAGMLVNSEVKCAVIYDGANIGVTFKSNDEKKRELWASYADSLFMLHGWSADIFSKELAEKGEQLNLLPKAHKIAERPILFIAADSEVIPIADINEIVSAMREVKDNRVDYMLIKDDHSFNNNRTNLIDVTRKFLNASCR